MKKVLFLLLTLSSLQAMAEYTCTAYCGKYRNNGVVASERNKSLAWKSLKEQCEEISPIYDLYDDRSYNYFAQPNLSCSQD